jgi:SMI1 / KNR4 family (SUKH-1)
MYQQLLARLRLAQATYGEQSQPPCPDERLARLRRRVHDDLGAVLPDEYAAFLRTQDGLNHNGLFVYASETTPIVGAAGATIQGIVEANLTWRDDEQMVSYLVFGDGNLDLYALHVPTGEYHVVDRVPGNLIATYPSFEQLLAAALEAHL